MENCNSETGRQSKGDEQEETREQKGDVKGRHPYVKTCLGSKYPA